MTSQEQVRRGIGRLMRPASVVILGVSATKDAGGNQALHNLRVAGYTGTIHVVHPSGGVVDGIQSVSSIDQLPHGVDLALLNVPARSVLTTLEALAEQGVGAALVPSGGVSTEGVAQIRALAARVEMVIHGPNCMGVLNFTDGVPLWFYRGTLTRLPVGKVALVTQSGSASFLARGTEGVGLSHIISSGNEAGLSTADYLDWLADEPGTTAVGVVMESIRDRARFVAAVARLRAAGKPLVVLKVGRTDDGARASVAHTGAIAGGDEAYQALFRMLDVATVDSYDEMAVVLSYLGSAGARVAAGPRAAVITDSGGEAGLAADLATRAGVPFPSFAPTTATRLRELLPGMEPQNPLDAGGSPGTGLDLYYDILPLVVADDEIDIVAVVFQASEGMSVDESGYAHTMFSAARRAFEAHPHKPVVIISPTSASIGAAAKAVAGDVPILRGLAPAIATFRALGANKAVIATDEPERPGHLPGADRVAHWRQELQEAPAAGSLRADVMTPLLLEYGVRLADSVVVASADEAAEWASSRYPVAVKVASVDVPHRSDVGGVVLGVSTAEELEAAGWRVLDAVGRALPDAVLDGVEVQRMIPPGPEVLIGFRDDPAVGPVVSVGSGGVLVELLDDVVTGLAPMTASQAAELVGRTRLARLLDGYRGVWERSELDDLVATLVDVSWLAHDLRGVVVEGDLNPVIVEPGPGTSYVADALLVTGDRRQVSPSLAKT